MTTLASQNHQNDSAIYAISGLLATLALAGSLAGGALTGGWLVIVPGGMLAAVASLMLLAYQPRPKLKIAARPTLPTLRLTIVPDVAPATARATAELAA